MITISVSASRSYNVMIGKGTLARAGAYIKGALDGAGRKLCIVTDANVDALYGQREHVLWRSLEDAGFQVYKYVFPGGEAHKNMSTITAILEFLAKSRFSRSDVLLALGGGVTGDVTGFAAATYQRGVEFIQVPTSLLAIVDSSVGGKTGVNLSAGKNLAGAFWQPSLVLFDPLVLSTLSDELKLDGIAEAVKAGIIGDPSIIEMAGGRGGDEAQPGAAESRETSELQGSAQIQGTAELQGSEGLQDPLADDRLLTRMAANAVEVKRRIVEEDERESNTRQLLNLGHTLAHAIEKCSDYAISHGHAVAMGMDMISAAADSLGWSSVKCRPVIHDVLKKYGFPLDCRYSAKELTAAALQDKKIRGEYITLVIPDKIGKCMLKTIHTDELEGIINECIDPTKKA